VIAIVRAERSTDRLVPGRAPSRRPQPLRLEVRSLATDDWERLLSGFHLALSPGRTEDELRTAEGELSIKLPTPLRTFLGFTDGFVDLRSQYEYAWNLRTIVTDNLRGWSSQDLPLDRRLLGFGGDGSGGWFCLSLDRPDSPIFHLGWILGELTELAGSLSAFWPRWLDS
jgi:hypothetical protein